MHKWIMFALFLVASAMAVVFSIKAALEKTDLVEETAIADNELRIIGKDFEFNESTYYVAAGEPLVITYYNEAGGGVHEIVISNTNIHLAHGDRVEYVFDKPGEFDVSCSVFCGEGHQTMVSKLIVQ